MDPKDRDEGKIGEKDLGKMAGYGAPGRSGVDVGTSIPEPDTPGGDAGNSSRGDVENEPEGEHALEQKTTT